MAASESFIASVVVPRVVLRIAPCLAQRFIEQVLDLPRMLQRVVGDETHLGNPTQMESAAELATQKSLRAFETLDRFVHGHFATERPDEHIRVLEIRGGLDTGDRDRADSRILALRAQKRCQFLAKKLVYAFDSPMGHIAFRAR